MSRREPEIALRQIHCYAKEAVDIMVGKTREDLDNNRLLNLALVRLLEMIGEAANRVPDDLQDKYYQLPWLQMIGLRNRLIHGYDSVDFDILWAIIQRDLPDLIAKMEQILDFPQLD